MIVVIRDPSGLPERAERAVSASTAGLPRRVGLVVATGGPAHPWHVEAINGALELGPLGLRLDAVPHGEPAESSDPSTPPPGPTGERPVVWHRCPPSSVEVAVLGPVFVQGAGVYLDGGRPTELVAYLAMHSEGVSGERLRGALWESASAGTLNNVVSAARRQLGSDASGAMHLPHVGRLPYRLGPGVGSDLRRFEQLAGVQRGSVGEADALEAALALVRGQPFECDTGYEWAHREGHVSAAQLLVARTAHRLAELCLAADDLDGVEGAARAGLLASPGDETLYRDRMLAQYAFVGPSGVNQVIDELRTLADAGGGLGHLHPDTVALCRRLGGRAG